MIAGLGLLERLNVSPLGEGFAGTPAPATPGASAAASFAAALGEAATRTVGTLQQAESLSMQALKGGDVQTREVVDAVMSAEQSLQAAVAIRDKIVSAYLEVSRMAI